ncbi:MAG TPA: DUF5715 family protein [Longimicrobiaceae bacterium]|nr:DUF5715 family protein [Longimicrobiaceae bacterium]
MYSIRPVLAALTLAFATAAPALASSRVSVSLDGSHASMIRQHHIAKTNDYTFLRTGEQIHHFVDEGWLVPVKETADLVVSDGVSYPVARPELRTFLERLAREYREGCGERMVVTSLTRPLDEQPWNSSPLSVHPAGMASDLRVPANDECRLWLRYALLGLERKGVLDVTREHHPRHFHVALFTKRYIHYAAPMIAADSAEAARAAARAAKLAALHESDEAAPAAAVASIAAAPAQAPEGDDRYGRVAVVVVFFGAAVVAGMRRKRSQSERDPEAEWFSADD